MKVVVIGPVCRDLNLVAGKKYARPGGVTCYAGQALACLGVETLVLATCAVKETQLLQDFKPDLVHLPAKGTIEFINEYRHDSLDSRIQRAVIHDNSVQPGDIKPSLLSGADYIILGPLFYDNISWELVEYLAGFSSLVLAVQGMIRYLDHGRIVWKNPEKVLDILTLVDYLFLDEQEARFISGNLKELSQAVRVFEKAGVKNIVVTRGRNGSLVYAGKRGYEIKAFPPHELVDPTGAGDTYMAGFIKALELSDNPVKQGEFAAMTATVSIENSGPFNSSLDEVIERLGWKV